MPGTEHLDQYAPSRALDRAQIPNLDLAPLFADDLAARDELEQQIRDACLNSGFFYVHNSCVDKGVIRNALAAAQAFFQMPDDGPVKQAVHCSLFGKKKGWGPMFGEPAYQPGTVAHVESFDLGQQLDERRYRELGIEPNVWPDIPGFRDAVHAYYDAVTAMARTLGEAFSGMLGMERGFINRHSGERAPRTMRLLHYPANDAPVNERNVGIAAHTDFECFTIINQTASGLELTNADGEWCQAPSDISTFTVMLGDVLEHFSNGYLKATGHRVVNTPWQRFSMVLFFAVDGDYEVAPLEHFTSPDNPARYAPVTQGEHVRIELERAAGNKLVG
ncbi:MAG: 2-oxoglutarate and iron-dependent oxygenase domain-containing protein [Xanthomonadales bacterium]|nr:2-oxoglutarate and iron-dependent oxygenase domain-containing protein [Xanthomonadales bacterium]